MTNRVPVRWTVARCGLDRIDTLLSAKRKGNESRYSDILRKKFLKISKKYFTNPDSSAIIHFVRAMQLKHGLVVQSVSTPACHAGGRRFESVRGRQKSSCPLGQLLFSLSEDGLKVNYNCPVGSCLFPSRSPPYKTTPPSSDEGVFCII